MTKLDLANVSCLGASDYQISDLGPKKYNFKIFGRVRTQVPDKQIFENISPAELGFDTLNRVPDEVFEVRIHKVSVIN